MLGLARRLALHVDQLVAADLAQPGEQRGLAPEAVEVANRLDERGLHQILDGRGWERSATRGKGGEPSRVGCEERIECARVACQHPRDEPPIFWIHLRA